MPFIIKCNYKKDLFTSRIPRIKDIDQAEILKWNRKNEIRISKKNISQKEGANESTNSKESLVVLKKETYEKKTKEYLPKESNVFFQEEDELTPDYWIKRSPHLIRLTGKHPLNAEPPLTMLYRNGFKTPNDVFFVRNHGAVPKIEFGEHRLHVNGLVKRQLVFTMEEIMKMDMITENVVFSCTGNRRKELNILKKTRGFNFGAAAIGTAEWTGVPLYKILEMAGINSTLSAHVHLEGSDELPKGSYDTSVPLTWCLDPSRKFMVAVKMNGDPIPYDHGFPIRAILPGLTGGRMIKWLRTISIQENESTNYYHINDNRVIYPFMDEECIANQPDIVKKKEFCVYELNIQSVIVFPTHDEVIDTRKCEKYLVKGFALTGGLRWINRVDISLDKGVSWLQAQITRFGKELTFDANFTWVLWTIEVSTEKIYQAAEISVRAVDSTFNTQPENRVWNIMGMMNNSWYRVRFIKVNSFITTCQHPTLAGSQSGGWMEKETEKTLDNETTSELPTFTWDEIEVRKKTRNILVINGHVYDVTDYKEHPGGIDALLVYNGEDCSEEFNTIHSVNAFKQVNKFLIGKLRDSKKYLEDEGLATIVKNEYISDDLMLLQLQLNKDFSCDKCFHVMLKHPEFEFTRAYTPIDYENNIMSFVIRIYAPCLPKFPNGGKFTQILKTMNVGEKLKVMGPYGELEYVKKGNFKFQNNFFSAQAFHFFAAGTGIAPIYSCIKKMFIQDDGRISITVTHCCPNQKQTMLKTAFMKLFKKHKKQMAINYIYRNVDGYLTLEKMKQILGDTFQSGNVAFLCGRSSFTNQLQLLLRAIGYSDSSIFIF